MRCKRHTVDFSSNNGVCASCLRERLLSLAVSAAVTAAADENNHNRKSNNPPLLSFPRSVSPYVTRRKSDAGRDPLTSNRRFVTASQVDLGYSCKDFESKSKLSKISRFSNLFKDRSEDSNPNSDPNSESSASSSRSWFSAIISGGRRNKQPTSACYIEDVIAGRRPQRVFCRGMSPARDTEPEDHNDPPPESTRRTPAMKTPGRKKIATGIGKSMSGMAFCLSPLVRASPSCPFKRKVGNPGEITAPEKPHISAAASFCANRSKKLVDLGRVNRRR